MGSKRPGIDASDNVDSQNWDYARLGNRFTEAKELPRPNLELDASGNVDSKDWGYSLLGNRFTEAKELPKPDLELDASG